VARFDHDKTNTEGVSASAGSTMQKLRSTLERYAREEVEQATARAAAIEEQAVAKANEIEAQSQRKADEVLKESRQEASDVLERSTYRAEGMLQAIETLQGELAKVVGSFREEVELLASELKSAKENLTPVTPTPEPTPADQQESAPEATHTEDPQSVAPEPPFLQPEHVASPDPPDEQGPPAADGPAPEPTTADPEESNVERDTPAVAQAEDPAAPAPSDAPVTASAPAGDRTAGVMVQQQLVRLKESGKPRADAERYLNRFADSGDFAAILEDVYGPAEPAKRRRRGLLRRR
jgi:hypothetical protein